MKKANDRRADAPSGHDDKLSGIIFISVPADLQHKIEGIDIDPGRLLPVETGGDADKWDIAELSWEMIIAGMLKILAFQPGHEDAAYYRAFVKAVKPELCAELTEAGIVKCRNHDFDLAEEIFRALVGLEPDNCRYLLNLALLFEQRAEVYATLDNAELQDDYERQAHTWYRHALSLDEVLPEAHLYAGYFFMKQNDFALARQHFTHYLGGGDAPQRPAVEKLIAEIDQLEGHDNLFKEAYDFIRMDREAEGIAKIKLFLERNPTVWNAWFILGWGHRRLAQYAEARAAFEQAVAHGGDGADTLNELAICQMELGDYKASRASLEKALGKEHENVKIMSNLGILALKQDKTDEAMAFFRAVLEFVPDDPIALRYLEHLEAGGQA